MFAVSARDLFERRYPRHSQFWKFGCFEHILRTRVAAQNGTKEWEFVSVGDSNVEHLSAREVSKKHNARSESVQVHARVIKCVSKPSEDVLLSQIACILKRLRLTLS